MGALKPAEAVAVRIGKGADSRREPETLAETFTVTTGLETIGIVHFKAVGLGGTGRRSKGQNHDREG